MGKKCIGIDVGGTTVKVGMFELDGTLVKKWEVPTRKEENGKYILPDVAASIRKVLNEQNISLNEVAGAGLGIPGPVLPNGFVEVCVNLGWREMNPQEILSGLLDGMTVKTGNDANVAALGEMWQGGGKGYHDIVMVTLGTGIGGGFILNGRLYSGSGMAGEIGHMVIEAGGFPCSCGRCGCWEAYSSAPALIRMAHAAMEKHPDSILHELSGKSGGMDGRAVFQAAEMGDSTALELCRTYGNYLAEGLTNLANLFDPEVIAIGGGISGAPEHLLLMPVREAVRQKCYTGHAGRYPQIVTAALGGQAGMIGAASLGNAI